MSSGRGEKGLSNEDQVGVETPEVVVAVRINVRAWLCWCVGVGRGTQEEKEVK